MDSDSDDHSSCIAPHRDETTLLPFRARCWLDAMKASSPPHHGVANGDLAGLASDELNSPYRTWMKKYPSALHALEQIVARGRGKEIALFLDYDGTLSPIVDDPDNAVMSDAMREVVRNIASYLPTAIISGRCRDKVFEFVKLKELYYAGSHGMDIMGPARKSDSTTDQQDKEVNLFQPATEFVPMIDEAFKLLVENTEGITGAKVENNKFCASVHYRNVDEKDWQQIAQVAHDVLRAYPRLRLTHGRKVLEIRPVIDWNKGKAVEFLLESIGLSESDNVLSIYIGDDRTDEDAFKFLREGKQGFGIIVSSIPKESDAFYSLKDTSEVKEFLKALVRWKEAEASPRSSSC